MLKSDTRRIKNYIILSKQNKGVNRDKGNGYKSSTDVDHCRRRGFYRFVVGKWILVIRNIKEKHGLVPNSKNKHFEYRLVVLSNFE